MASGQVETATGPVDAKQLGFTLAHEHVLVGSAGVRESFPFLFDNAATRERIVRELAEAKAGGVDTIIDLTTMDLGRDVEFFAEVSHASGMQIVVCTGLWLDIPRVFLGRDPDFIADIFVHEIEHGIAGTNIKPGVIKVANDMEGVTPEGEVVLRAAARACKATGVPISTHQWAPDRIGARQVEIFQEEGIDMSRVCIGHSADTTDIGYLTGLLGEGVYLSMDRYPGREERPNWEARNVTVKALVDRGFADRLMLGHDYAPSPVLAGEQPAEESGPTTYLFLSRTAIPALRQMGVSEAAIHAMTVEVPRRFLCGGD